MKHIQTYESYYIGGRSYSSQKEYKSFLDEQSRQTVYYHGTTDKGFFGKNGIHIGTRLAATQALESRIGIPAEGSWDGTREYGKTLLAGRKALRILEKERGYYLETGYNCGGINDRIPDEDYYPTDRPARAKYSDYSDVAFESKPIIFPVKIIGKMANAVNNPKTDTGANRTMMKKLKDGTASVGYYYVNEGEDEGSISAVVPDGSFLEIVG